LTIKITFDIEIGVEDTPTSGADKAEIIFIPKEEIEKVYFFCKSQKHIRDEAVKVLINQGTKMSPEV
jgi:hypothetical protein